MGQKKYYKICKAELIKEIKALKTKILYKQYKLLNKSSLYRYEYPNYKYEPIVFLLFKFYYIIKKQGDKKRKIITLFNNFRDDINIECFKYFRIFYIIINKIFFKSYTKIQLFEYIFEYILFNKNNKLINIFDEICYLKCIETLFFYNFFCINTFTFSNNITTFSNNINTININVIKKFIIIDNINFVFLFIISVFKSNRLLSVL